jgi:hypothetical protein
MNRLFLTFEGTKANPQSCEHRPMQPDPTDPGQSRNPQSAIRNPQS